MKKKCDYCRKEIVGDDQYVILSTIKPKIHFKQTHYFHLNCFVKNHDEKVNAKARNIVTGMQQKAVGMFQGIQDKIGNFAGSDQLQSMLNIDLTKEIPTQKDLFGEDDHKKENGKRKSRKKSK